MPRLPPSLFWRARRLSPGAALLLPVCRDLPSAATELRWIREHVAATAVKNGRRRQSDAGAGQRRLLALCRRRGRGEPLQYVLGTQPFGPLDLLCRRGVLIPRPEPEAYSMHLADRLLRDAHARRGEQPRTLTVLDACTGTGCIALLLSARLHAAYGAVQITGLDLAPAAVRLARANAVRNGLAGGRRGAGAPTDEQCGSAVQFVLGDLFADDWRAHPAVQRLLGGGPGGGPALDVLVSNPPYVSAAGFAHDTARSVRLFEPRIAQVPTGGVGGANAGGVAAEDVFYVRLLQLAAEANARIVLCEVGGLDQARRVAALALQAAALPAPVELEIWADSPDIVDADGHRRSVTVGGRTVPIVGSGHGRSVFVRLR